jgi:acyl-CoA synthetase (AMP-forming)/AMP-acid ligase II
MPLTFCERLIASCDKHADKVAMRIVGVDEQSYDYGELLRRIRSIAYRLRQEGVAFGDRVAVMGENHPSWAAAYLATIYSGSVCVPLDPHGEIETITNFLENSEAKIAFLSPRSNGAFLADPGKARPPHPRCRLAGFSTAEARRRRENKRQCLRVSASRRFKQRLPLL